MYKLALPIKTVMFNYNQKLLKSGLFAIFLVLFIFTSTNAQGHRTKPKPAGVPAEIQVTPYKTTMIADGKDEALINIKIIDSHGDSVLNTHIPVTIHITGDAKIINVMDAGDFGSLVHTDSTWQ